MSIKPKLAFFDLTMIVVSLVIGTGIFATPAIVANNAQTPVIFFTAWILGGVISIFGALTFAEIGSRVPAAGGFYKIFSYCYHPAFAFMLNWALVITNSASAVGVGLVGAKHLLPVLLHGAEPDPLTTKLTALGVVTVLYMLNFLGIKAGARTQNVLSLIKIGLILALSCAIFIDHTPAAAANTPAAPIEMSYWDAIKALGICLSAIFFTYGGYQNTINFGADIEKPERNIPRSIFAGVGIVIVLYLLINVAYYSVLGFAGLQATEAPAAELANVLFGEKAFAVISIAVFLSTVGFINTSLMNNPRMYYAMAEDKILPPIFKKVNEKTMTQEFALSFFFALMLLFMFVFDSFRNIVDFVMFIDSFSLVTAAGTVFILRYRENKKGVDPNDNVYRMKFYPLVPILFMFVLLMVTVNIGISNREMALYGLIIFLAGYPLFQVLKRVVKQ